MSDRQNQSWNLQERFQRYPGRRGEHASTFANRKVVDFNSQIEIIDPVGTAYALRYDGHSQENAITKLEQLLENTQVNNLEALIIGLWVEDYYQRNSSIIIDALVAAKEKFKNLKALFIGDIHYEECEISWITQSDISPILAAYPNLELLQVRGGTGLGFTPVEHRNLETLIVETGGLTSDAIAEICACNLPQLTHLELWLGSSEYSGDSSIDDLQPILGDRVFPNLVYLGLRNSEYSQKIAEEIVNSSILNSIRILDLSMGTLTDTDVEILIDHSVVKQLEILNLSENYLSDDMLSLLSLEKSRGNFQVHVMTNEQKEVDEYEDEDDETTAYRYCSVAE
jgi:hypothetical protein